MWCSLPFAQRSYAFCSQSCKGALRSRIGSQDWICSRTVQHELRILTAIGLVTSRSNRYRRFYRFEQRTLNGPQLVRMVELSSRLPRIKFSRPRRVVHPKLAPQRLPSPARSCTELAPVSHREGPKLDRLKPVKFLLASSCAARCRACVARTRSSENYAAATLLAAANRLAFSLNRDCATDGQRTTVSSAAGGGSTGRIFVDAKRTQRSWNARVQDYRWPNGRKRGTFACPISS